MDGGEGPRRLDELDKLVVVADDPLCSMRARECGPKRERLPVPVQIEDRGSQVWESMGGTRGETAAGHGEEGVEVPRPPGEELGWTVGASPAELKA